MTTTLGPTTVGPDSVLDIAELSMNPQAGGFVVGRMDLGKFVVLPEIGISALESLRAGHSVQQTSADLTPAGAAAPVDVLGFAQSLLALGFATVRGAAPTLDRLPSAPVTGGAGIWPAPRARLGWLFSRPVAALAAACAVAAGVLMAAVPDIRPQAYDVFFLGTPARSLAALTLITYLLAFVHEMAHVYGAAAIGVPARLRITRRLYFLTFETNLTGLWALPPRRRIGPLLAGMGFDAIVLAAALALRAVGVGPDRLLAAIALVELFAIATQLFVFLRTDVYSVMTTLLGCTNLSTTTRLMLRRLAGLLTQEQRAALAAARPRDLAVARWYRWVHLLGMAFAAWFFVVFFLPSTWHLLAWMWQSTTSAGPTTWAFYEAVVLGGLLLSPRILTLAVAIRDNRRRSRRGRHRRVV